MGRSIVLSMVLITERRVNVDKDEHEWDCIITERDELRREKEALRAKLERLAIAINELDPDAKHGVAEAINYVKEVLKAA